MEGATRERRTPRRMISVLAMIGLVTGMLAGAVPANATASGTLVAWGRGDSGETTVPAGLTGVTATAGGYAHTLALKSDGTVVGWGYNDFGQTDPPPGLTGVIAIAAGYYHSLALKSDGTVVAWGYDLLGQTDVPAGLTGVVAIAAGVQHSLALKSDGTVVGWGYDNVGQTDPPAGLTGVVAIAAGADFSVALKSDGTVVAWGASFFTSVPGGLTGVTAIAAGPTHTMALKSDGTVVAWGDNPWGQLNVPGGLTGVTAVAAGGNHSLALKSDGTVVGWGYNAFGQINVPAGLTGVFAIAAGYSHSLALQAGPALEISNVVELADPVGRFERFEADITLSRTYANPFDPGVIMVDVTFTAPSGAKSSMPAFWFQDFEVRAGTESFEVYDPVGDPSWRVRFAPAEIGIYSYVVHAVEGLGGSADSAPTTFEVTETANQGFVRVDGTDARFFRFDRGAPYVPLGHNAGFDTANPPLNGTNYYEALFDESFAPQENWTRIWMTDFNRSALEWGPGHWSGFYDGVGAYSLPAAWRMDQILGSAEAHGLYVQLVLNDHGQYSSRPGDRWPVRCNDPSDGCTPGEPGYDPGNPYSDAVGGPVPADRPDQFFSNAQARDLFERRLRYVVARWGGYTNVLAWELFNEVQFVGSDAHNPYNDPAMWANVLEWHEDMASYLASIDPNDHLVTTSSDPAPAGANLGSVAGIDIVQVHDYTVPSEARDASIAGFASQLQVQHGKPVIIGEFGVGGSNPEAAFDPVTFAGTTAEREHLSEGTNLHNAVWTGALSASGSMTWWWDIYMAAEPPRNRVAPDFPLAPRVFPAIDAYLNGEDLATLGLDHSALSTSSDVFAVGLNSDERAFLWVRDVENEFGTGARPGDLAGRVISGSTVEIPGMADGDYRVRVFDTYGAGGAIASFLVTVSGGLLHIDVPNFMRDVALKLQPIAQRSLGITKGGTGDGTVTSNPAGIDCGTTCDENFEVGTLVTLTPSPQPGSTFDGWGGDCSGVGTCTLSMSQARSVTSTFTTLPHDPVWAWGYNQSGQLGYSGCTSRCPTPALVNGPTDVVAIAAGFEHSLALESDGQVWAWGLNFHGQLGYSGCSYPCATPTQVAGLPDAVAIAAGEASSLALGVDGRVYAWGNAAYSGCSYPCPTPTQITGLPGIVAIAAGDAHNLALDADGHVWAWGLNSSGQLGYSGCYFPCTPPTQVAGLPGIVAIAGGALHSLALDADGRVWAWGHNDQGQLGSGCSSPCSTPTQVTGLSDIIAITGGEYHSLALDADGRVWAWGTNTSGQLGYSGCYSPCSTPTQVAGLPGIVAVNADVHASLAIDEGGVVWAWGSNGNGNLGPTPTPVSGLSDVVAVAGGYHSLAIANTFKQPGETVTADVDAGDPPVSTDVEGDGATPDDPVETQVSSPNGGTVTIEDGPRDVATPSGYNFFGEQMTITAPDATVNEPLVLVFVLDASQIPAGQSADTLAVFRNGAYVLACTGSLGTADPDPCVSDRQMLPDGDAQITVLTSEASDWNLGFPAPVADAGGPYSVSEGSTVQLDATHSTGVAPLAFDWFPSFSLDDATLAQPTFTGLDDGAQQLTLQVTEGSGQSATATTTVTVSNAVPVVHVTGPASVVSGATVALSASFTDAGRFDTHTTLVNWGDGTTTTGTVTETNGSGTAGGSHRYLVPGSYAITVKVTDDDGGIGQASSAVFTVSRAPMGIDVKPGDSSNTIALSSKQVGVAVLSTSTFNATTQVVRTSLTFGRVGSEASLLLSKGVPSCSTPDVNSDGRKDLQCNFTTSLMGLRTTDTQAILRARRTDGVYLEGRNTVRVIK